MIHRDDVEAAHERIRGRVRRTPVLGIDDTTCFKLELHQHTGTFKVRGAFNRILSAQESGALDRSVGIVVASGGNAGLANAFAAREVGVPAVVFVPETASRVKVERLRAYGAEVVLRGSEFAQAHDAAMERVAKTDALYCHAYDQPEIAAGAGTLALELLEQADAEVDTILVAVGGGGLMSGIAAAAAGRAAVVGVEPATAPTLRSALEAGGPVDVEVSGVAADSLGARRLGEIAYDVAVRTGVRSVLVSDDDLVFTRRALWDEWRIVVEYGAAAAFAALRSGAYAPGPGERVAVVLCGANTDPADLGEVGGVAPRR